MHRSATDIEDLAGLADGSLAPERRAELEALVAASPQLAALLAEQVRAVQAARALGVSAPESLRARIEAERRLAKLRARRRPRPWGGRG